MEASPSYHPLSAEVRHGLLEMLIDAAQQLHLSLLVKYTALSFFADRFLPSLLNRTAWWRGSPHWLLRPIRESSLQLFALAAIWIASKIHSSRPLSVKSLKSLGDNLISDQHFTTRDFVQAELVFMEVLGYNISASRVAFVFLEDLLMQFRGISKFGELVTLHMCMEIMDLLYETEQSAMLFTSPYSLAASVLVTAYVVSVPKQPWEFPLLPWVKFVTGYEEDRIMEVVHIILQHILKPDTQNIKRSSELSVS